MSSKIEHQLMDFITEQQQKERYPIVITRIFLIMLEHFVNFLHRQGIRYNRELKEKHVMAYFHQTLEHYQFHLHETIWEFYAYTKKEKDK